VVAALERGGDGLLQLLRAHVGRSLLGWGTSP
jgi:hypothetical protein